MKESASTSFGPKIFICTLSEVCPTKAYQYVSDPRGPRRHDVVVVHVLHESLALRALLDLLLPGEGGVAGGEGALVTFRIFALFCATYLV